MSTSLFQLVPTHCCENGVHIVLGGRTLFKGKLKKKKKKKNLQYLALTNQISPIPGLDHTIALATHIKEWPLNTTTPTEDSFTFQAAPFIGSLKLCQSQNPTTVTPEVPISEDAVLNRLNLVFNYDKGIPHNTPKTISGLPPVPPSTALS